MAYQEPEEWAKDRDPDEVAMHDKGYPGLGPTRSQDEIMKMDAGMPGMYTTSFAANDAKGRHICDFCNNPYNPVMPHYCYEMAHHISTDGKIHHDGRPGIYCSICQTIGEKIKMGPSVYSDGTMDKGVDYHTQAAILVDPDKALSRINDPAVWTERIADNSITYEIRNIPNDQAIRIMRDVLPKALELYMKKSKDYGGNVMSRAPGGDLGPKACIPDMQRKFGKLVDAVWWDKPLQFEQPEEILQDLLGHILIILDEMSNKDEAQTP